MGWRLRRSIKIMPGVRVNLGKRGTSISFGIRGLRTTVGNGRSTTTVGIPGTGLAFTTSRRIAGSSNAVASTGGYKAELAAADRHPARLAFQEQRKQRKRAERLAANGGVEPSGPLVCPECLYERKPQDRGSPSECIDCGFVFYKPIEQPRSSRTSLVMYIAASVALALCTAVFLSLHR